MSEIKGLYYCGGCRTHFYTDDGLARHLCPGRDFETHPIGTLRRIQSLKRKVLAQMRQINRLQTALNSIKIIASDMEDPERLLGPGWHDGRESDGRSDNEPV